VSQYYTAFSKARPDPAETWDQVTRLLAKGPVPSACDLFGGGPGAALTSRRRVRTWAG
jgi:hypothetical protein